VRPYLPSMPQEKREPESKFWSDFESARPALLGALLDVVSGALGRLPNIQLSRKPRMADFAAWATAAETPLGFPDGAFIRAYAQNQSSANDLALEASPVAGALQGLVLDGTFEGTAAELLQALTAHADESARSQRSWPVNGRVLSNTLRRLAPNLRNCGIDISYSRGSDRRRRRLITVQNVASTSSTASEEADCSAYRSQEVDPGTASLEASGRSAVLENRSDTQGLIGTLDDADDVDARTPPSEPVPIVAGAAGQSSRLQQHSQKGRLKGEL
jgi:hypothetical protein